MAGIALRGLGVLGAGMMGNARLGNQAMVSPDISSRNAASYPGSGSDLCMHARSGKASETSGSRTDLSGHGKPDPKRDGRSSQAEEQRLHCTRGGGHAAERWNTAADVKTLRVFLSLVN